MNNEKKDKIDSFFNKEDYEKNGVIDKDIESKDQKKPFRMLSWVILLLIIVGIGAGVVWMVKNKNVVPGINETKESAKEKANNMGYTLKIDSGKHQAVFLTNGQVYFGKLGSHDEEYVELTDIFYLQVVPVLQQKEGEEENNQQQEQQQQTELSLVKLGNELHGPLDRMMINKDQIMFIEDMKDSSKVTEAIKKYQEDQKNK